MSSQTRERYVVIGLEVEYERSHWLLIFKVSGAWRGHVDGDCKWRKFVKCKLLVTRSGDNTFQITSQRLWHDLMEAGGKDRDGENKNSDYISKVDVYLNTTPPPPINRCGDEGLNRVECAEVIRREVNWLRPAYFHFSRSSESFGFQLCASHWSTPPQRLLRDDREKLMGTVLSERGWGR